MSTPVSRWENAEQSRAVRVRPWRHSQWLGPVAPQGVQPGVAQHDFGGAAGGRVTVPGRPQVPAQGGQHRSAVQPANSGVLR